MVGPDKTIALKADEQLNKLKEAYNNAAKEKIMGGAAPIQEVVTPAPVVEPIPEAAPEVVPAAPAAAPVDPAPEVAPAVQPTEAPNMFDMGGTEATPTAPVSEIPADSAANLFDEPAPAEPEVVPEAPAVNPFDTPADLGANMFDQGGAEEVQEVAQEPVPENSAANLFDETPAPEAPQVEAPVAENDVIARIDALQKRLLESYMELDAIRTQVEVQQKQNNNTMHM